MQPPEGNGEEVKLRRAREGSRLWKSHSHVEADGMEKVDSQISCRNAAAPCDTRRRKPRHGSAIKKNQCNKF